MIQALALGLNIVLLAIASLHLYWGFGGFWPGLDNDSLVGMVVGLPPGTPMPPLWACMAVAFCLLVPSVSVAIIAFGFEAKLPRVIAWMPVAALLTSALVFVARGIVTYSGVFDATKVTQFYALNRMVYSPLCLALGLGLVMVWVFRPASGHQ